MNEWLLVFDPLSTGGKGRLGVGVLWEGHASAEVG